MINSWKMKWYLRNLILGIPKSFNKNALNTISGESFGDTFLKYTWNIPEKKYQLVSIWLCEVSQKESRNQNNQQIQTRAHFIWIWIAYFPLLSLNLIPFKVFLQLFSVHYLEQERTWCEAKLRNQSLFLISNALQV